MTLLGACTRTNRKLALAGVTNGRKQVKTIWIAALGFVLGACVSQPPEPLELVDTREVQGTVVAIDRATRLVAISGPEGNTAVMEAGPEVRNFDQVQEGDILKLSYTTVISVAISDAEAMSAEVEGEIVAGRAEAGDLPGAVVASMISETVELVSKSEDGSSVTIRGPDGELRSMDVVRQESQAFVQALRPGDLLDMSYAEAVAAEIVHVGP